MRDHGYGNGNGMIYSVTVTSRNDFFYRESRDYDMKHTKIQIFWKSKKKKSKISLWKISISEFETVCAVYSIFSDGTFIMNVKVPVDDIYMYSIYKRPRKDFSVLASLQ